ncbi:MAG: hypothetical protein JWN62_1985 [Acidimicrobiales bacterium]|nr:hypothetical protein [Acidimicrobiales bacterium]
MKHTPLAGRLLGVLVVMTTSCSSVPSTGSAAHQQIVPVPVAAEPSGTGATRVVDLPAAPTTASTSTTTTVPATTVPATTTTTSVPPTTTTTTTTITTTTVAPAEIVDSLASHHPSEPGRLVILGDSIAAALCANFPASPCEAFPGAWVADVHGNNIADQFVTAAALQPTDTVVLSNIGGFHSEGIDDAVILTRLTALYQRISSLVHRLIVLVAPYPNFPLCIDPSTPEAVALLAAMHDNACATLAAVADLERSWPVTVIPINGPYEADQEHETAEGRAEMERTILGLL